MNLTIGKLAAEAGINTETVRYYERRGLIRQPPRPASGFRQYDENTLHRLRFIRKSKDLGFKLDEIESLLRLSEQQCADVQSIASRKLAQVQSKIRQLTILESTLDELVRSCDQSIDSGHCPIIGRLLDSS